MCRTIHGYCYPVRDSRRRVRWSLQSRSRRDDVSLQGVCSANTHVDGVKAQKNNQAPAVVVIVVRSNRTKLCFPRHGLTSPPNASNFAVSARTVSSKVRGVPERSRSRRTASQTKHTPKQERLKLSIRFYRSSSHLCRYITRNYFEAFRKHSLDT